MENLKVRKIGVGESFGQFMLQSFDAYRQAQDIFIQPDLIRGSCILLYLVQRILELYRADLIPPEKNIYFVYLFFSQHLFNPCFLVEYIFVTSYAVMSEVLH